MLSPHPFVCGPVFVVMFPGRARGGGNPSGYSGTANLDHKRLRAGSCKGKAP